MFFLAMMLLVYVRGHFGYFLLSSAFLVVFVFTMIGWWLQRRNVVEAFDRGLIFKRSVLAWDEIADLEVTGEGGLKLTTTDNRTITVPRTLVALDRLEAYVRGRASKLRQSD